MSVQAAIARQLSADARQASTHFCISPRRSQSSAHSAQISAHSRHTGLWCSEPISMKCVAVRQISAHAVYKVKCAGSNMLTADPETMVVSSFGARLVASKASIDAGLHGRVIVVHDHSP